MKFVKVLIQLSWVRSCRWSHFNCYQTKEEEEEEI